MKDCLSALADSVGLFIWSNDLLTWYSAWWFSLAVSLVAYSPLAILVGSASRFCQIGSSHYASRQSLRAQSAFRSSRLKVELCKWATRGWKMSTRELDEAEWRGTRVWVGMKRNERNEEDKTFHRRACSPWIRMVRSPYNGAICRTKSRYWTIRKTPIFRIRHLQRNWSEWNWSK